MILLIDNYDSFTFNIYDYLLQLGQAVRLVKNDQITLDEIEILNPEKIIISPGPGNPDTAGITLAMLAKFHTRLPILGICLGHQVIAQYFGYKIIAAPVPAHGKIDYIQHDGKGIFQNLANPLQIVRYHSLIVAEHKQPTALEISAYNNEKIIMALRHKIYPIEAVQFHPESILTEAGLQLIANFVNNN